MRDDTDIRSLKILRQCAALTISAMWPRPVFTPLWTEVHIRTGRGAGQDSRYQFAKISPKRVQLHVLPWVNSSIWFFEME
jgi:hypothetical protein